MSNQEDFSDQEEHYEMQAELEDSNSNSIILLPLKRNACTEKDSDLRDLYKLIRKQSTIEKKRIILGIESQPNKKKFPLYGLTSPVPYPSLIMKILES